MKIWLLRILPLFVFLGLAVFFWRGLSLSPQDVPAAQLNKQLPNFQSPSLFDKKTYLTPKRMHGNVALLNVWASWCHSCEEEQVFLMQLAKTGIAIYGLNFEDVTSNAIKWLREWGNPYTLVGVDSLGHVAIDLGVSGVPETFLIDKDGVILYRHAGPLNESIWQQEFAARINTLNAGK